MIAFIDPHRAPLANVPSALQERKLTELAQSLSERGINLVGGDEDRVFLNLRNLALANGSLERGQQALYAALEELACVRVDVELADITYLLGSNVESLAVTRGLEAGVPTLVRLLTSIEPSELFENLDKATAFIYQDRATDEGVHQQLMAGAAGDLLRSGIIGESVHDINALGYDQWLTPPEDPLLQNLDAYARSREDVQPFRSSWDVDEI
jgi:hypothetical protein